MWYNRKKQNKTQQKQVLVAASSPSSSYLLLAMWILILLNIPELDFSSSDVKYETKQKHQINIIKIPLKRSSVTGSTSWKWSSEAKIPSQNIYWMWHYLEFLQYHPDLWNQESEI